MVTGILIMSIPTTLALSGLFSDIPENAWYKKSAENMYEKEIMLGYEGGTFEGEEEVNRAQLAQVIERTLEHEQKMNESCDRLSAFTTVPWFDSLNEKYFLAFWEPMGDSASENADMAPYFGKGCFTVNQKFVFMPGQDFAGCHTLWVYDWFSDELEEVAKEEAYYCAQKFTNITNDYLLVEGVTCEGGPCRKYTSKYYFRENKLETNEEQLSEA